MKPEQTHIDHIRAAFTKMQSREDLLQLLNEAKPLIYGDKAYPFKLKQLTWYANPKLGTKRYSEFKIKKKSGAERSIHAPIDGLKAIQKTLSLVLQCVFEPHKAAMGFVRDKSIVDNARIHEGSNYVYNIDLKDFFPSIDQARVWKCLQLTPFNLNIKNNKELPKTDENANYKVLQLVEHTVWPKETNNVLAFIYDGFFLKSGKRKLHLKAGGYIVYKVEVDTESKQKGSIYIYEEKSQFDQIKELARNSSEKENSDFRRTLLSMLFYLVSTHSIKTSIKNSRSNLANIIAALCCTEIDVERKSESGEWEMVKRNVLPQGAPTSPVITNIVCQRLDFLLSGVAKRFGLKYSRYADDITFSSMHNVYQPESEFLNELHRIIAEQGFHIKETKTRLQKDGHRKEVTGLLVNEKVNVQQRYIKQLRMWLYYWEKYGYERASGFFLQQYLIDKGHIIKGKPDMANVISGKLEYLKMVKGADNSTYLSLKSRFETLTKVAEKEILELNILKEFSIAVEMKEVNVIELADSKPGKSCITHNPKDLIIILKMFSDNNNPLKYTTHSWEHGKFEDYDDFINKIKVEWKNINSKLYLLNKRLHAKISSFLFNEKLGEKYLFNKSVIRIHSWGEHRIEIGWSSPDLKKFCSETKNEPFYFPIPINKQINLGNKTLSFFYDIVDVFKREIEFREENNQFSQLLLKLWTDVLTYDFELELENTDGISFYTDVQWISQGIKIIFESIRKRPHFNKVKVQADKNFIDGYIDIKIIHLDSPCTRDFKDPKIRRIDTGDFSSLSKNFENLCDWSVSAKFPDNNYYIINYLVSTEDQLDISQIENCSGFTHTLRFYL